MNKQSQEIGKRVKELRLSADMSMDELGRRVRTETKPEGVTKQTVNHWETGRNQMTAEVLVQICDLFGVSSDYVLYGESKVAADISKLDGLEGQLIGFYRSATKAGKDFIMRSAIQAEKLAGSLPFVIDHKPKRR